METPSRRTVLATVAATVTLPALQAALGRMKAAQAAAPAASAAATSKSGWITTTLKAADLKEDSWVQVAGQKIVVSRSGKTVMALSSVCTHKGQPVKPKTGDAKIIWCPSHGSEFKLDGSVNKAPAAKPLDIYAIRLDDKGMVEIDPSQKVAKDAKEASVTLS
ncbi:MAG TPA: Rieske (2Fe-2S) protein [Phycisphaerae bacterium]|jgi:cytochrome b6-f complex iron-sulfur subunit|nr:Rieske (2Fe-2S) protein [Phycisphaerae bacterium]